MNKLLVILLTFGLLLSGCTSRPIAPSGGTTYTPPTDDAPLPETTPPPLPTSEAGTTGKKSEIESNVENALPLIYTDYDYGAHLTYTEIAGDITYGQKGDITDHCYGSDYYGESCYLETCYRWNCYNIPFEEYFGDVQEHMDQGTLYLAKAKAALAEYEDIAPSDSQYVNGWNTAISALEYEADGTRKAAQANILDLKGRQIDEDYLTDLSGVIFSRRNAVTEYEKLLSSYPDQAEEIGAISRLQILRDKIGDNTLTMQNEIDTYESQAVLSAVVKLVICTETGVCVD